MPTCGLSGQSAYTVRMKVSGRFLPIILAASSLAAAHGQELTPVAISQSTRVRVSILSDTNGVSLTPYMRKLVTDLKSLWLEGLKEKDLAIPADRRASVVDLTIGTDGRLLALHRDTTANTAYDEVALASAKSKHYAALPSGMKDAELKLRVEFSAN